MIQRIQSVFFLITGLFFGGEFVTSFATSDQAISGIFSDQMYNLTDHIGLQILAGAGILFSLIAIFLFKKRATQMRMGYLITTLAILLPIVALLIFKNQSYNLDDIKVNDGIGLYLPIGMIISSLLAIRFVKKDEKLVQSMDRLR